MCVEVMNGREKKWLLREVCRAMVVAAAAIFERVHIQVKWHDGFYYGIDLLRHCIVKTVVNLVE